jgi:hypothetical protein
MTSTRPLPLLAIIFVTGALSAACTAPAGATPPERIFSVSGHGEARGAPDIAMVSAGVRTEGPTAKEALQRNTAEMTGVFKAMKALGIADKDMQTSNFSVQPVYKQYPPSQPGPQLIVGYQVFNQVTATVRELPRLGEALDAFVTAGANELYGVQFTIDKPDALQDQAREDAVKDAMRKADLMAKAAGVKLGRLMTMSESGGGRPRPAAMAEMRMAKAAPVPIAAGEQVLEADVSLTYEIQ